MNETVLKVKQAMLGMQRRPWEQGVAAQALLELGDLDMMVLLAIDAANLQADDGRLAMPDNATAVTDPAANGEAVLAAAKITNDPALRRAAQRMIDYLLHTAPRTPDGVIYHINNANQIWIDSMYMTPPFLAVAGYPEEGLRQIEGLKRYLWHSKEKLFSHIWDHDKRGFAPEDYWGVGNGWAAAGMTRVIRALSDKFSEQRTALIENVKSLIDACLKYQRNDGLFHDVIDDPATFVEVNLAQMLAYSIYRGIKGGWLATGYQAIADQMREAAHSKVDEFGFVRDVCGAPNFDRPGIATEGQAFFLLMEAAHRDLVQE